MAGVSLITGGKGQGTRSPTDFYPTPTVSTNSLFDSFTFEDVDTVLEPACGKRHISKVVQERIPKAKVESSDLHFYGDPEVEVGIDFLSKEYLHNYDMVITNPPYTSSLLMPFVEKALAVSNRYMCMFLKITFLESLKRYEFFQNDKSLKTVLVFSNRQPLYKDGIKTGASNAIMYAWFVWDKKYSGDPSIKWINNSKEIKVSKSY